VTTVPLKAVCENVSLHYLVKCQCIKASIENKTSKATHFKKLTTGNNVFIVSVSSKITPLTTVKPKFHLARHVSTQHDSTRHVRRVERVETSVSSRAFSNMADDEEAVVLACTSLVFCALSVYVNKTEKTTRSVG